MNHWHRFLSAVIPGDGSFVFWILTRALKNRADHDKNLMFRKTKVPSAIEIILVSIQLWKIHLFLPSLPLGLHPWRAVSLRVSSSALAVKLNPPTWWVLELNSLNHNSPSPTPSPTCTTKFWVCRWTTAHWNFVEGQSRSALMLHLGFLYIKKANFCGRTEVKLCYRKQKLETLWLNPIWILQVHIAYSCFCRALLSTICSVSLLGTPQDLPWGPSWGCVSVRQPHFPKAIWFQWGKWVFTPLLKPLLWWESAPLGKRKSRDDHHHQNKNPTD